MCNKPFSCRSFVSYKDGISASFRSIYTQYVMYETMNEYLVLCSSPVDSGGFSSIWFIWDFQHCLWSITTPKNLLSVFGGCFSEWIMHSLLSSCCGAIYIETTLTQKTKWPKLSFRLHFINTKQAPESAYIVLKSEYKKQAVIMHKEIILLQ